MTEDINNLDPFPEGDDVTSPGGNKSDDLDVAEIKHVLGEALGKEFPDNETALKSVRDTFSYVGKVGKFQPILEQLQSKWGGEHQVVQALEALLKEGAPSPQSKRQDIDPEKFVLREQYEADNWYVKNSQYEPHRNLIEALKKSEGKTREEVTQLQEFKDLYDKAIAHDVAEGKKSVLHSNQRVGQATDKLAKAREAVKVGDKETTEREATSAVLEAYGDK